MMRQQISWDGPGESRLTALVENGVVSMYLCDEEDEFAIQDVPFDGFKVWASTVLAEVALVEKEEGRA